MVTIMEVLVTTTVLSQINLPTLLQLQEHTARTSAVVSQIVFHMDHQETLSNKIFSRTKMAFISVAKKFDVRGLESCNMYTQYNQNA